ncbi:MAG: hypothetical protein AAF970_17145 [Bacteroidota bacterium]
MGFSSAKRQLKQGDAVSIDSRDLQAEQLTRLAQVAYVHQGQLILRYLPQSGLPPSALFRILKAGRGHAQPASLRRQGSF